MTRGSCICAALCLAGSPLAPAPTAARDGEAAGVLARVLEARPVRLDRPVPLWRDGKREPAQAALLLRVSVTDPFLFMPRGAMPPSFVLGEEVCTVLRGPFPSGEAVLLAPVPPPGQPLLLWLAPVGMGPQGLRRTDLRRLRPGAAEVRRGAALAVTVPRGSGERRYKDVTELLGEFRQREERPR